jgi:hypothetical protein
MKTSIFLLVFNSILFCNDSCKHSTEGQRFIIRNNSDNAIVVQFATNSPVSQVPTCMKPTTSSEYEKMIHQKVVFPNSEKNFERNRLGELMISRPNDTLYIGVFYRTDIDAMSCEEFKQKFPLKHEWKVTLSDMEACDWTLAYFENEDTREY